MSADDLEPCASADDLFQQAACGLVLTEADGTIRRTNQAFCRWLGTTSDSLVDRARLQDLMTTGARIFHHTHWAPLLSMQGSVAEVKLDFKRSDGAVVPMIVNVAVRQHCGRPMHHVALFVAEDRNAYERELLHARRRAEQHAEEERLAREALAVAQARLAVALDAAQLHSWSVDPQSGQPCLAPSTALLLGYPEPRTIGFDAYSGAIELDDRARALGAFFQRSAPIDETCRATYRLNGVDGVQRTVLATTRALRGADDRRTHVIGLLQDISELAHQRSAAEDRAQFAEQMIGIVSHDLRNPLSAIANGAALLRRVSTDPTQLQAVGFVSRSADRAHRLIDDLLDFTRARIGAGLPIAPRWVEPHPLVLGFVEDLAAAHATDVLTHVGSGAGEVFVDPDRLYQLLGNLVANAVRYGQPGAPITVATLVEDNGLTLRIDNQGEPIAPGLLPKLFDPMVRGTSAGDGRSVGLGLFIVREIARAHGGRVRVSSSVTEGTRFEVQLPAPPPPQ